MKHLDRRSFLEIAGKSAGLLGVMGAVSPAVSSTAQTEIPEIAVIGAGAFGGWTALYLREMGFSVTLIDAYGPGNARSSSAGETRQIRAAYGDREIYSRWALQALERWKARETEWGRKLLFETCQVTFGSDWSSIRTTKAVLDRLGVENEILPQNELSRRYPQFDPGDAEYGFFLPSTGVLLCRGSCLAVADAFQRKGGNFILAKALPGRRAGGRLQDVTLSNGVTVSAQSFVFACGPWHPKMFPEILGKKLRLNRRTIFFMGTAADDDRLSYPNCPTFTIRGVYGFPNIQGKGLKIGPYWDSSPLDPDTGDRTVTTEEIRRAHAFADTAFPPLAGGPLLETRVSPRTDTVDGHFIVDRHPELANVWIVGGGSGHGFKHGPMMGEHVAARVTGKETSPELVETFRLKDEVL
jgi:sarcosine oxidase